jgi:hypothetical protein
MTKPILIFALLLTSSIAFCQDSLTKKNNIKISILSFVDNAKINYERLISKNLTIGLTASYFYLEPVVGIKIEPSVRHYFKSQAPIGWYIETKLQVGYFSTKEIYNKIQYTYNSNDSLINEEILESSFRKKVQFIPFGASLKIGQQILFGKNKRFVFDYNFGLQYFSYNYPRKKESTEYFDLNGNRNVIETSPGSLLENFPGNEFYWNLFGPGSIFYSNISIGYNF